MSVFLSTIKYDLKLTQLSQLFNFYAEGASYFDICLLIYQAADHRNPTDIRATWQNLFESVHERISARGDPLPYEAIIESLRLLGPRLTLSETIFPVNDLVPMLKRYAFEYQQGVGPETWVIDVMIEIGVPFEALYTVLESMLYGEEAPFHGARRRFVANDLLHLIQLWYRATARGNGVELGGRDSAAAVEVTLDVILRNGSISPDRMEDFRVLMGKIRAVQR